VSRVGRWVPLLAVVALLGAAMLAANFADPVIDSAPLARHPVLSSATPADEATPAPAASASAVSPPRAPGLPAWVGWLFGIACAVAVLVILAVLVVMALRGKFRGRRLPAAVEVEAPPTVEETERQVRAAVEAGLAELDDTDADPRAAVIACWVRLEAVAALAGSARSVGDTSTELVARLLATRSVSVAVLDRLAEVYREARFATHPVDEATRDQARAALRLLRDELIGGRVAHGG
jgi:Domain of unknown function (DUF4129)